MKFKITRTSLWGAKEGATPCEGATISYEPEIDVRKFSSFEQHDKYGMEPLGNPKEQITESLMTTSLETSTLSLCGISRSIL